LRALINSYLAYQIPKVLETECKGTTIYRPDEALSAEWLFWTAEWHEYLPDWL